MILGGLSALLGNVSSGLAAEPEAAKAEAKSEAKIETSQTVAIPDITTRVAAFKKLENEARGRLREIEKKLMPIKEELVQKLMGITPQEYAVLRIQAGNVDAAKTYLKNYREDLKKSYEGIGLYFDQANTAITKNNLWFGQEETLVDKDVELLTQLEQEVLAAMTTLPNSAEVKGLLAERDDLQKKLANPDAIALYQINRKGWFSGISDYGTALQEGRTMPVSKKDK